MKPTEQQIHEAMEWQEAHQSWGIEPGVPGACHWDKCLMQAAQEAGAGVEILWLPSGEWSRHIGHGYTFSVLPQNYRLAPDTPPYAEFMAAKEQERFETVVLEGECDPSHYLQALIRNGLSLDRHKVVTIEDAHTHAERVEREQRVEALLAMSDLAIGGHVMHPFDGDPEGFFADVRENCIDVGAEIRALLTGEKGGKGGEA